MRFKSQKTITLLVGALLLIFVIPNFAIAGKTDRSYNFYAKYDYYRARDSYSLEVSVTPSLFDYYRDKSHIIGDIKGYANFVTPDAVRSIAENIENVTRSDEEFANAVLMLVHQIPYAVSDVKYPVETIVDNSGDCDTLSLLAASIMKAGGLDVVFFYFKEANHVNIGVYLPNGPHRRLLTSSTYYEYNGKKYWVGESTPAGDWKLGDFPGLLAGSSNPVIIPLENTEQSTPAGVSSSLNGSLMPSSISLSLASDTSVVGSEEGMLSVSGSISPEYSEKSVVMYVSQGGTANTFTTETDNSGKYSFMWNFSSTGTYYIRTSWSGASNYAGADSETFTVFVGFYQPSNDSLVPTLSWGSGPGYTLSSAYEFPASYNIKEFFKTNLTGTGILLSGEFIVLRSGQTIPSEQTITVQRIVGRHGTTWQRMTIVRGAETISIPRNINQFGFFLQHDDGNNYSASARVLDNYDISQITKQPNGNSTVFMNVSTVTKEDTWYNVVAKMSGDRVIAELYDLNGTLLNSLTVGSDGVIINQFGILMADDSTTDTVIAFKDLKVEALSPSVKPDQQPAVNSSERRLELFAPYVEVAILLAAVFVVIIYVTKKKAQKPTPEKEFSVSHVTNQC